MSRAPRVDVTDRVIMQLATSLGQSEEGDRALAWSAAVCVAAAVGAALVAVNLWESWSDPVLTSLAALAWELLI